MVGLLGKKTSNSQKSRQLKSVLQGKVPDNVLHRLPGRYDCIGDVAVIGIPEELLAYKKCIGEALLTCGRVIRVAARRVGYFEGEYRTIELEIIAGCGGLETIHKEYGIVLHVDPSRVYFSPRTGPERKRIADSVAIDEDVLVAFSGIAPLVLMLSLNSSASTIVGIEKNPIAHGYALKNVTANTKAKNIQLYHGDVSEIADRVTRDFHRVVMPLPGKAIEYIPACLKRLKKYGWLHYYTFGRKDGFDQSVAEVVCKISQLGREVVQHSITVCGHTSPGKYRICIDMLIK